MIEAGCIVVDILRCSKTSFPNVTTRSFCLLNSVSTMNVFSSEKMVIRFPCFFRSFNKRVLFRHFQTIAAFNRGFLERLRLFLSSFWPSWTQWGTEIFFCSSLVIFWLGPFSEAYLVASWLIIWGLPDRGRSFRDCCLQMLFQLLWKKQFSGTQRETKLIFQFFWLSLRDTWSFIIFHTFNNICNIFNNIYNIYLIIYY